MKTYGTIFGLLIAFFVWASPIKAQEMETLSKRQEAIVPIASMTAKGDTKKLHQALTEGLEAGLTITYIIHDEAKKEAFSFAVSAKSSTFIVLKIKYL